MDWDVYDIVVVRSTWDYAERRGVFLEWAADLPRVLNALPVLVWNTDKTYLRELQAAGVPTVATTWADPGSDVDALALPHGEVVVKPAVSAGSRNTERYADARDERARSHMLRLLDAGYTVMVQPYLASVDRVGETGLVYMDGEFSHALNKAATLISPGVAEGRLFAPEQIASTAPAPDERRLADHVLETLRWRPEELLYARVDLVRGEGDRPTLIEVELTEPSLYFGYAQGAADRFARALARRLHA